MYVHRRCVLEGQEIDFKRKVHGYCGICGNQGTVYHVKGTQDHYLQKRQGVTYSITGGEKEKVNVTEGLVYDEIAPSELPAEEESVEGIAPSAEVQEEALEDILDDMLPVEKEPEKTPLEAKTMDVDNAILNGEGILLVEKKKFVKEAVEAEPELIIDPIPLHTGSAHTPSQEFTEEPLEVAESPEDSAKEVKESLQEEPPEETAPDTESEPIAEEVAAESPEAVVEAAEVTESTIDPEAQKIAVEAQEAKKTKIAALEAELEELQK